MAYELLKLKKKEVNIPSEVWSKEELTSLEIIGQSVEAVPDEVKNLKNLEFFSITSTKIGLVSANVFNLPKLKTLKIKGGILEELEDLDEVSESLETIIIISNKLKSIPAAICGLPRLKTLDLTDNCLSSLPETLGSLKLKRLILDKNEFTKLPACVEKISGLGHLSIDGNNFSKEEKQRICDVFSIWFP